MSSLPPAPPPLVAPDLSAARERYAVRIKLRLARPVLTLHDARDGIRDCFLSTYLGGLNAGVKALQLKPEPHHLEGVADQILRRRLQALGSSWESPTLEALEQVKLQTDAELHFDELPVELHAVHDQVCSLLLSKVSGEMPHRGDVSVLGAGSRAPDEVELAMRRTIATFLGQFQRAVEREETPDELLARLGTLGRLIETLQLLSPAPTSGSSPRGR
jgi:hypothetical protein